MIKYFHNCTLVTPGQLIPQGALIVEAGRIAALGSQEAVVCPAGAQGIDGGGGYLVPGFIDLQINGGFGIDFSRSPEAIWQVGAQLPQFGVTYFLPTLISCEPDMVQKAQEVIQQGAPQDYLGALALGLHLEGPFLNPAKRGAHPEAFLRSPDVRAVELWSPQTGIRLVTLAPELNGALEVVRRLVKYGVVVGSGHSIASYAEAMQGVEAGIRYGTHLFNAMPPLDHRQPGLVSALLTDRRTVVGIIADGIHVDPAVVKLIWEVTGGERLNLVTDAMAGLGMPPGTYQMGENEVFVDESSARLSDGRLAGSRLALDQALRNLKNFTGCSLPEAIQTITSTPAKLLGLAGEYGQLAVGQVANLVNLTSDLGVSATYIGGEIAFHS